jgi:hypothetical protein
MTTISDLNLSKITQVINSLKQQLPPNSELAQSLTQQTLLWMTTVQGVKAWLALQQCLQLIETEEQKATLSPVLRQIKNIISQAVDLESQIVPFTTSEPPPVVKPVTQPASQIHEVLEKPAQPEKPVKTAAKKTKTSSNQFDEETSRQYCWELAHCSTQAKLTDSLRQSTAPTAQPQSGDVVLHGTVLKTSSPVWIAPLETIPTFSQLAKVLPMINLTGQIWLDFSDIYTAQHFNLSLPKWCQDKPDTHLLWHRWIDLLYWTVMTPEHSVFVNGQKAQQLSTDRENILKTLLTIHKDFEKGFNEPDKFAEYLGSNLHKLYAVFHQFLTAEDMMFDAVPKQVFANLRRCVANNLTIWQKQLVIHEEHSAGPLDIRSKTSKEYLASVTSYTENMNNVQLPLHHPFSQQIKAEKSQVLYWTRPYWKQPKLPPTHHYFDLKGSVLYGYE